MLVNFRHLTAITLCASLIGCAQLTPLAADATPAERMVHATERHLMHEQSYNFAVNIKVDELTLVDAEKSAAKPMSPEQAATDAEYPELAALSSSVNQKLLAGKNFILGLNVDATGAVDTRRGKLEIIPAVRFQSQNLSAKATVPMLFDLGNNGFYIDPAALTHSLPELSWLQPYQQPAGTFYRITLAESEALAGLQAIAKDIPLQDFLQLYVDSYAKAVASIPPQRLQMVAVDDWGKSINASQQINSTLSLEEYLNYTGELEQHLLAGTVAYFKRYNGKAVPPHIVKAIQEIDLDAQQMSRAVALSLLTDLMPDNSELSADTEQLAIKQSLYLDANHRLIGQTDGIKLNLDSLRLNVNSRTHLSNFGRPNWQINPKKAKVIDANVTLLTDKVWQSLISNNEALSHAEAYDDLGLSADSIDAAAAAWAEEADPVAEQDGQ
ncbi:MAG: hypothetical protein KBC57_09715 [Neisseriaceae bacterium]|nr:hypothetical protein [Neisseriaceae bacterium]